MWLLYFCVSLQPELKLSFHMTHPTPTYNHLSYVAASVMVLCANFLLVNKIGGVAAL